MFPEYSATHLENSFEPFAATLSILSESLHARFLDLIFDLLPTTAESGDFRFLVELGGRTWIKTGPLIDDSLADVEDVGPGKVGGAHRYFLRSWIDVGDLIDVGRGAASEERKNPLGHRLVAGNEAFGS